MIVSLCCPCSSLFAPIHATQINEEFSFCVQWHHMMLVQSPDDVILWHHRMLGVFPQWLPRTYAQIRGGIIVQVLPKAAVKAAQFCQRGVKIDISACGRRRLRALWQGEDFVDLHSARGAQNRHCQPDPSQRALTNWIETKGWQCRCCWLCSA